MDDGCKRSERDSFRPKYNETVLNGKYVQEIQQNRPQLKEGQRRSNIFYVQLPTSFNQFDPVVSSDYWLCKTRVYDSPQTVARAR